MKKQGAHMSCSVVESQQRTKLPATHRLNSFFNYADPAPLPTSVCAKPGKHEEQTEAGYVF